MNSKFFLMMGLGVIASAQGVLAEPGKPTQLPLAPGSGQVIPEAGPENKNTEANIKVAREFVKTHADYIMPEFEKVLEGGAEEHIESMLEDIFKIMEEHSALKTFNPAVASLFLEVLKLEHQLYAGFEFRLEKGESPEVAGEAMKPMLRQLVMKRILLEKGQVAFQQAQLAKELKQLDKMLENVNERADAELKEMIRELKAEQEGE